MSARPSLLFVNQHYYPDFASTGQHLTDLAEHLAAEGYDVSVLCSQGRYLAGTLEVPKREVHPFAARFNANISRIVGRSLT